jgi:glutamate dehydrogenase/leucine dehydrogenase
MSLKTAAVGLPLGGGKGGVAVDPRQLTSAQLEELSRKYVTHLHRHIGPDQDVPAPDVNTNAQIIDWMVDEYEKLTGDTSKASFTGKSLQGGGSLGRPAATGRGGVIALREYLRIEGKLGRPLSYAVQGFGNVGSFFSTVAATDHAEWKLVAASDSTAAVYAPGGLHAQGLADFKASRGRFADYARTGVETISGPELLALDVDVLILAGLGDAVTDLNVRDVKASLIVELANGPIDGAAAAYLDEQGVTILPDVVANAGGVVVSYLEWVQNKTREHWTEERVNDELEVYMTKAVTGMHTAALKYRTSLKEAAFIVALERLTDKNE